LEQALRLEKGERDKGVVENKSLAIQVSSTTKCKICFTYFVFYSFSLFDLAYTKILSASHS